MREDFMKRIEAEHLDYIAGIASLSKQEIIEKAGEIAGMTEVYQYLKNGSTRPDQLEYLAQAAYPLREIYGFYAAYPRNSFEHIDLVIYDICDKDLFLNPEVEKYQAEFHIRFHRKPSNLSELKAYKSDRPADRFKVEKIIELTPEQFLHFSRNLLSDSPIITQNQDFMWHDGECWHCLLVRSPGISESILVESEKYDYARYCAFVPDSEKLDLRDVPIERYTGHIKSRDHKNADRDER